MGRVRAGGLAIFVVVAAAALVAGATQAKIRPYDQDTANVLTLRLDDFDQGWKVRHRGTTRLYKTSCASAPKIQFSVTGFSASADFSEIASGNDALTVTRIFPSERLAKTWFKWAAGPRAAKCNENVELDGWRKEGYQVTNVSSAQESYPINPDCGSVNGVGRLRCYDGVRAWRNKYTLTKAGGSSDTNYDYVAVRYGHAVVAFHFFGSDFPLIRSDSLTEAVLSRVQSFWWPR